MITPFGQGSAWNVPEVVPIGGVIRQRAEEPLGTIGIAA